MARGSWKKSTKRWEEAPTILGSSKHTDPEGMEDCNSCLSQQSKWWFWWKKLGYNDDSVEVNHYHLWKAKLLQLSLLLPLDIMDDDSDQEAGGPQSQLGSDGVGSQFQSIPLFLQNAVRTPRCVVVTSHNNKQQLFYHLFTLLTLFMFHTVHTLIQSLFISSDWIWLVNGRCVYIANHE